MNFWASWCPPCIAGGAGPAERAGQTTSRAGVQFVGIDAGRQPGRRPGPRAALRRDLPEHRRPVRPGAARLSRHAAAGHHAEHARPRPRRPGRGPGARPRRRDRPCATLIDDAAAPRRLMSVGTTITDGSLLLALPLALAAGLVSFLSPCVLPLVPGYLSYVTGHDRRRPGRPRTAAGCSPARCCSSPASPSCSSARACCFGGLRRASCSTTRRLLQQVLGVPDHRARPGVHGCRAVVAARPPGPPPADARAGRRADARRAVRPRLDAVHRPDAAAPCWPWPRSRGPRSRGGVLAVAYCLGLGLPFVLAALAFSRAMGGVRLGQAALRVR